MPRRGYKFVNHTADIEYVSYGGSLAPLFRNAFLALFDTISYLGAVSRAGKDESAVRSFTVKEKADSLEDLAWLSLQDAVSEADANGISPFGTSELRISKKDGKYSLYAVINGVPQSPSFRKFDVKGVSKYRLKVGKENGRYSMSIVLDV